MKYDRIHHVSSSLKEVDAITRLTLAVEIQRLRMTL